MGQSIRTALVVVVLLAIPGCGGSDGNDTSPGSPTAEEATESDDHALGESNIKYDALDAMEARGAVAPVIEDFSCTWSADTIADCSGTGYDVSADQSECGYVLLPCGNYDVVVHAECADGEGHDCDATLELRASG